MDFVIPVPDGVWEEILINSLINLISLFGLRMIRGAKFAFRWVSRGILGALGWVGSEPSSVWGFQGMFQGKDGMSRKTRRDGRQDG